MPRKRHIVNLTDEEKEILYKMLKKGKASARKINRAHTLLLADEGKRDEEIAGTLHIGTATVERIRKRFVEGNLGYALNERPRPGGQPKLDGKQEAYLVALAYSTPPEGRDNWTMQLLADKMVEIGQVDSISDETVRRALKKRSKAMA